MSATAGDAAASQGGSLRDLNAQLAQLAVDARSAPERIRGGDLHHERPNSRSRARAPGAAPRRAPCPLAAEPLAMPTHDGVRVHDDQGGAPILPRVGEQHPKQSISVAELGTPHGALEHGQLLTECQILERDRSVSSADQRKRSKRDDETSMSDLVPRSAT